MRSHYNFAKLDFIFGKQFLQLKEDTVVEHSVQESCQAVSDSNCAECFLCQPDV